MEDRNLDDRLRTALPNLTAAQKQRLYDCATDLLRSERPEPQPSEPG